MLGIFGEFVTLLLGIWLNFFDPDENLPKCGFFTQKMTRFPLGRVDDR
jgi:hypothetical protein